MSWNVNIERMINMSRLVMKNERVDKHFNYLLRDDSIILCSSIGETTLSFTELLDICNELNMFKIIICDNLYTEYDIWQIHSLISSSKILYPSVFGKGKMFNVSDKELNEYFIVLDIQHNFNSPSIDINKIHIGGIEERRVITKEVIEFFNDQINRKG
jgi:hypothetical protein